MCRSHKHVRPLRETQMLYDDQIWV